VKDLKQFISGPTFARGSNQPFILNAIVFLSSSRADIFRLFNFENTVEGDGYLY
jgi:carbamate kinase